MKPGSVAKRHEQLVKAMTAATVEGVSGNVMTIPNEAGGPPLIRSKKSYQREMNANFTGGLTKSTADPAQARLTDFLNGPDPGALAKEWSRLGTAA